MNGITNDTKKRVRSILQNTFDLQLNDLGETVADKNLLGNNFRLTARDLLYLYILIEKEFNISIPQEDIVAGKFNTINNIIEIIETQLKKTKKDAV